MNHDQSLQDISKSKPENIFREYYGRLSYFAFQYVKNNDIAEDLVQDAFMKYWDCKKNISEHPNAIKDFLYTTVRNAALNYLKRQKVQERYFLLRNEESFENEKVLESIIEAEVMAHLHHAISQLPQMCRSVFELAYFDGLSNPEIAKQLNISINTVRNHKQYGLKLLRSQLSPENFLALLLIIHDNIT